MKEIIYKNIKYIIGINSKDNWDILDIYNKINKEYIWFHLNSFPSCYVIMCYDIKLNNDNLDKDVIEELLYFGANICKDNTKYKNFINIKICYTELKKLTKTNKVGEVIVSGKKKLLTL
jgi:hypothetical protein